MKNFRLHRDKNKERQEFKELFQILFPVAAVGGLVLAISMVMESNKIGSDIPFFRIVALVSPLILWFICKIAFKK